MAAEQTFERVPLRATAVVALITYLASIPAANWLIDHVGKEPLFPGGPHTIPVGPWAAPSGVLAIGFALAARDIVQRLVGRVAVLAAIAAGVAVSYWLNPAIATASAVAFAFGEVADFAVYTPLARRRLFLAVALSGIVGGVIDSLLFLRIAFGSFDFWQGQVVAKAAISIAAGVVIVVVRRAVPDRLHPEEN